MKDTHATRISGAVWFKHKYLTNPTVTPEDYIVAAIGGLAKTLTTKVPLQLRNTTLDKLQKLQDILEPQPIVEQDATQRPAAPIPPAEMAQAPRVISKGALAQPPRVAPKGVGDKLSRVQPLMLPEPQQVEPRQSPRITQLRTNKAAIDAVQLQKKENRSAEAANGPAQNTRSKRNTEERTILQETVLACIKTYVEVTQVPIQPAHLAQ